MVAEPGTTQESIAASSRRRILLVRAARWLSTDRGSLAIAASVWCGLLALIAVRIALGRNHVDSFCVYAAGAHRWSARQPLYGAGIDGFQYLPHAAIVFGPFTRLGAPLGDIAWRALSWALLAHGLWSSTALLSNEAGPRRFLVATMVVLGPALSSLFTGQANLAITGLMLETTVALARQRWWRATIWMVVGLAVKPLMAPLMLMACLLRPRIAPRLAAALIVVAIVPFAFAPAAYVLTQYHAWLGKLALSSMPDRYFEDIRGLAHRVGIEIPHAVLRVVRILGAAGAAALSLRIRRWREPRASFLLFAVAGAYLMLFNPRTQPNSYVIVAPAVALTAAWLLSRSRPRAGAACIAIAVCWSGYTPLTALWLKPLTCVIFCGLLIREIVASKPHVFALDRPADVTDPQFAATIEGDGATG